MTIALVNNNRGTQTSLAAGFDEAIDLPAGASIAQGNFLILTCAYDNSGTSGVDPNLWVAQSAAVTALPGIDLRGNFWYRLAKAVRTGGVANDGAVCDIWFCRVGTPYANGDDITIQASFPLTGVVFRIAEFSGIRPINYSIIAPTTATGAAGTSFTAPAIGVTDTQMVIAGAAVETNTAITGDADVLGGPWVTLTNNVANSGVDATSITAFFQYKIVNTTAVQNWTATKTGAADWAALAVVLDNYTPVTPTWISGNTHYPCPAGPEILPVGNARALVDTGTEYLFTHDPYPDSVGTKAYSPITHLVLDANLPTSSAQQHVVATDLYEEGSEETYDEMESVVLYVAAAGIDGTNNPLVDGAWIVGGGTAADALASVGGSYIGFDTSQPNPYVYITFDPSLLTTLFPNFRVLRWGIRYLAWKDSSSPALPGEGFELEWRDSRAAGNASGIFTTPTAGSFRPGSFLVNNYENNIQYELRWAGETNQVNRAKGIPTTFNMAAGASFTVQDLEHMANGDQTTGIKITALPGDDPLQTNMYLDYIEMVVELVPERRLGTGTRKVSSQSAIYEAGFGTNFLFDPADTTNYMTLTAGPKVMAVREALPASPSDYYAAQGPENGTRHLGDNEAIGPALLLGGLDTAYDTLADQPNLRRALLSGGIIASPPQELDTLHLAATTVDLMSYAITGSAYPAYAFFDPGNLGHIDSSVAPNQYIQVPGGQQYDSIKVLVRYDELTTGDLTLTVNKPLATPLATAVITKAMVDAAPKYGFTDWAEVQVPLSVAITPTAGQANVSFTATTPVGAPWIVSTAMAQSSVYSYNHVPTGDLQEWDYAVVLQCPLADPTYIVDATSVAIPPAGFGQYHCAPLVMENVPIITLTNADLYDYVTIQRAVGAQIFDVAMIADPGDDYEFIDYGCPWDLGSGNIQYIIKGYRATDHRVAESNTPPLLIAPTAPGALFGLASDNGLWVYAPTSDSGDLEITYNPLNPISKVQLHGYNYQVALRSPEERGLSVSVPVLVDSLACFSRTFLTPQLAPEFATKGQQAMSPTPFDPVRDLEKIKRHQLLLPGGHHRWVILDAGPMTVRTVTGSYIAEIELTDALPPSLEPWI